jgi:hypothetical protein
VAGVCGTVHQLAAPQGPSSGGLTLQDRKNPAQRRGVSAPAVSQARGERPGDSFERGIKQVKGSAVGDAGGEPVLGT